MKGGGEVIYETRTRREVPFIAWGKPREGMKIFQEIKGGGITSRPKEGK